MSEQPEALRLAGWIEADIASVPGDTYFNWRDREVVAELRRLVAQRDALLAVVNKLEYSSDGYIKRYPEESEVNAAISKAVEDGK